MTYFIPKYLFGKVKHKCLTTSFAIWGGFSTSVIGWVFHNSTLFWCRKLLRCSSFRMLTVNPSRRNCSTTPRPLTEDLPQTCYSARRIALPAAIYSFLVLCLPWSASCRRVFTRSAVVGPIFRRFVCGLLVCLHVVYTARHVYPSTKHTHTHTDIAASHLCCFKRMCRYICNVHIC